MVKKRRLEANALARKWRLEANALVRKRQLEANALARKRRLEANALARKQQLEADVWCCEVTETSVQCKGCWGVYRLDARNLFYPGLWLKHRSICRAIKKSKGEDIPKVRLFKKSSS
jgi:hypothetical protein